MKLSLKEGEEVKKGMYLNLSTILEINISMQANMIISLMSMMNQAYQKLFHLTMELMLLKQQKSIAWEKD